MRKGYLHVCVKVRLTSPLCHTCQCLSLLLHLLQSLPVVLYCSASRPEGILLDMDSGQIPQFKEVRAGVRPLRFGVRERDFTGMLRVYILTTG